MSTRYFCDTDCELWYTDIDELKVGVIRMPYVLDGKEYYYDFGEKTDFEHFYKRLREGATPTTSALNEYDYVNYFEPVFANGEDIFYIAFSSQMSATFEFMHTAVAKLKEKYPQRKFTYFDTKSISMGAGIQVYYAMKLRNRGASDEEVLAFLQDFTNKNCTYFCVDSLQHLYRGGRLSGFAAAVGGVLNLKPVIKVDESGKLKVCAKAKGQSQAIKYLANVVKEKADNLDKYDIWILQADCMDRAEKLREAILEVTNGKANIRTVIIGPVIGAHCGAGTLGVIFPSTSR